MKPYYEDSHVTIYHGDCREVLPLLPSGSVSCCVTSPPYWNLRDYGHPNQLGLEPTPDEFIAALVSVFSAAKRVMRDDSTLWINIGDSYFGDSPARKSSAEGFSTTWNPADSRGNGGLRRSAARLGDLKPKDLVGIPWMLAFALRADGYYLRSDCIWSKGNPMPESVTDRPTKAHEYLFLLAKAERYYYDADAIREPGSVSTIERWGTATPPRKNASPQGLNAGSVSGESCMGMNENGRNRRSVWTINTQPYAGAHFAVFPEKLIEPCILAGCPAQVCAACGAPWVRVVEKDERIQAHWQRTEQVKAKAAKGKHGATSVIETGSYQTYITTGWQPSCPCNAATIPGTVLDCFGGSGTTARVAKRLGRKSILIEQNEAYAEMAAASLVQQAFPLEVFA